MLRFCLWRTRAACVGEWRHEDGEDWSDYRVRTVPALEVSKCRKGAVLVAQRLHLVDFERARPAPKWAARVCARVNSRCNNNNNNRVVRARTAHPARTHDARPEASTPFSTTNSPSKSEALGSGEALDGASSKASDSETSNAQFIAFPVR